MANYGTNFYARKAPIEIIYPKPVSFDRTDEEDMLIRCVAKRYAPFHKGIMTKDEDENLRMTLAACNASGNPLDFNKMMEVDDSSFLHDIFGICDNIDVKTGSLDNLFVPRCSK